MRAEGRRDLEPNHTRPEGDARFTFKTTSECHFSNGTQRVQFLDRYFYNREEYLRFDSDVGEYRAVTELGRPDAEYWNRLTDRLDYLRGAVDTYCRHNYGVGESFTVQRRVQPKVTVYPTKTQPLQHHNLLVCSVNGFYPGNIEVRWFRNGQEAKAGVVSTGLIRNGDWTFQILVMLETVPQSGEVYTCQVEHPSLMDPVRVEWSEKLSDLINPSPSKRGTLLIPNQALLLTQFFHLVCVLLSLGQLQRMKTLLHGGRPVMVSTNTCTPGEAIGPGAQSEFVRGKMLSGIGGSVLGLLFLGVGLFIYFRNQKGHSGLQPTGLLS